MYFFFFWTWGFKQPDLLATYYHNFNHVDISLVFKSLDQGTVSAIPCSPHAVLVIIPFHSRDFTFLKKTIYFSYHKSALFELFIPEWWLSIVWCFSLILFRTNKMLTYFKVLFKFVCEPIFMLNPLPISNDFFPFNFKLSNE